MYIYIFCVKIRKNGGIFIDRLYYESSYIKEFSATVLSCEKEEEKYIIELDKTAFFPEGGGQYSDTGYIGENFIFDVKEKDGRIFHYCKNPVEINKTYDCKIDWEKRFIRMQNHSGEHIVSGIVHSLYGYNNVGFHLDDECVTIDFDGELTREQLDDIENKANKAVYDNIPFECWFANEEEIKTLDYRSKLDLTENVRLVKIGNIDLCACCAPHIKRSGEIGIIKLLDFFRHRNGVRIYLKCGSLALCDYRDKYFNVREISNLLSVKQTECFKGTERFYNELNTVRKENYDFKMNIVKNDVSEIPENKKLTYIFKDYYNSDMMREFTNGCIEKGCVLSLAFSGNDEKGYSYTALSKEINMNGFSEIFNSALNGKGGGRDGMIMGKLASEKQQIIEFLNRTGEEL